MITWSALFSWSCLTNWRRTSIWCNNVLYIRRSSVQLVLFDELKAYFYMILQCSIHTWQLCSVGDVWWIEGVLLHDIKMFYTYLAAQTMVIPVRTFCRMKYVPPHLRDCSASIKFVLEPASKHEGNDWSCNVQILRQTNLGLTHLLNQKQGKIYCCLSQCFQLFHQVTLIVCEAGQWSLSISCQTAIRHGGNSIWDGCWCIHSNQ